MAKMKSRVSQVQTIRKGTEYPFEYRFQHLKLHNEYTGNKMQLRSSCGHLTLSKKELKTIKAISILFKKAKRTENIDCNISGFTVTNFTKSSLCINQPLGWFGLDSNSIYIRIVKLNGLIQMIDRYFDDIGYN
jgi:hypothetical protein